MASFKHATIIIATCGLFAVFSCREAPKHTGYITQKVDTSNKAMIVAAHPLAVEAGLEVLEKGGNAIDAVVAVQFTLAVVYPRAGNIGGGGFMIYDESGGQTTALDFREKAPFAATKNMYLDSLGYPIPNLSTKGALAAGVPGSVDGLLTALEKYGKLKDRKLVTQKAIQLAKEGFYISEKEAVRLNKFAQDFKEVNAVEFPFVKDEQWSSGDQLVQTNLSITLQAIQDNGRAGFYGGSCAEALLNTMSKKNGIIEKRDLDRYKSIWKTPITFDYKDYTVHSMPLPSSGGIVLQQMLGMLAPHNLDSLGFQTAAGIHLLSEVERAAYEVRAQYMGDPDYYNIPVDEIRSDRFIAALESSINMKKAKPSKIDVDTPMVTPESFQTTHTSIIDQEGNSVSLTTTLNSNYGSKLYVKEAGFFLNNEMDDFSIKPGVPNIYGLVGAEANQIEAEKRMLSSMTPTIIKKGEQPYLVLGAPGGSTIITAVFQVFLNMAEYNMNLEESVNACRTHHQWLPDRILIEEGCLSEEVRKELTAMGHKIDSTQYMAIIKAIHRTAKGELVGVGDQRNPDDHAQGL